MQVYTKGACSSLKSAFEEHIAAKKAASQVQELPTPMTRRKTVVRQRSSNLPNMFQQQEKREQELHRQRSLGENKESIPMDKKIFTNFLDKFEDEDSRRGAKEEIQKLTFRQKEGKKATWAKREEEKRRKGIEEEERKCQVLAERKALAERRVVEEREKRMRLEEQEQMRVRKKQEEEQERVRKKEEESARAISEKKSSKKKKKLGLGKKKEVHQKDNKASTELPKIVVPTASTIRERIQATIAQKKASAGNSEVKEQKAGNKVGKLSINPFEQKKETGHVQRQVIIPAVKGNALSDIKKRYSSLFSQSSEDEPRQKDRKQDKRESDSVRQMKKCDEPMETETPPSDHDNNFQSSHSNMEPEYRPHDRKKSNNSEVESTSTLPQKKKSKEEMQSYLLNKLLFDEADGGHNVEQQPPPKDSIDNLLIDDGEPVELDPEYVKEIEQYLAFIDKPKKKGKKQNLKKLAPQLKVVEVNNIKNRFERKKHNPEVIMNSQKTMAFEGMSSPVENKVGRVKDLFETPKPNENDSSEANREKRKTRLISNDLLSKFDDPSLAEQMRVQKVQEREERKRFRLQKLAEDKKRQEEALLEAQRKEVEMLEALKLERLRREEEERKEMKRIEQEERQQIALEKMMWEEKERAELRRRKAEVLQSKREKTEPAFRKKKVLGRIQHIFDQKAVEEAEPKQFAVGSIKDQAEELFSKDDGAKKKQFQDASLAGVSSVLNKMKTKFDKQDEDKPVLLSSSKRKSVNPAAVMFEIKEQIKISETQLQTKSKPSETEWAWKKKAPQQLAMELANAYPPPEEQEKPKKSRKVKRELSEEEEKELLDDIHKVTQRLKAKDALKEHEEKMKEYDKFMEEIQSYLQEPTDTFEDEEFKEDIQNCIVQNISNKKHKSKAKPKPKLRPNIQPDKVGTNLNDLKDMLLSQNFQPLTDAQDRPNGKTNNIRELQKNLFFQEESLNKENHELSIKHIGRVKHHFDNDSQTNTNPSKLVVKKKIIDSPFNVLEEDNIPQVQKSSYEWKYKKKNIEDLQMFLEGNKTILPKEVASIATRVGKNLSVVEAVSPSVEGQDDNVLEYDALIAQVDSFLNAPDRTRKEIDFKEEIEKYLDLIEEPNATQNNRSLSVKRKEEIEVPKRNKIIPLSVEEYETKESRSVPHNQNGQGSFINDLKNRMLQVESKECKETLHLPTVGASTLKRTYEKLSTKDEVTLLGPRTIKLQAAVDEAATNTGVKSLEQIKAEKDETQWKWKNKSHHELYEEMREYDQEAEAEMKDRQEQLKRAEEELDRQEVLARTEEEIEHIKELREQKEREFENFIQEIKACVETPVEDILPHMDYQGYLDLVDDDDLAPRKRPSLYDSKRPKAKARVPRKLLDTALFQELAGASEETPASKIRGNIKQRREMLQRQLDPSPNEKNFTDTWEFGRVDTSFLEERDEEDTMKRCFEDPVMANKGSANAIKQKLLESFFDGSAAKPKAARVPGKLIDTSMFEKQAGSKEETLTTKAAINWKWKQKNIQDLQSFIDKNKDLVHPAAKIKTQNLDKNDRVTKDEVIKEAEENEAFLSDVVEYINAASTKDHENEFKQTIQVYLDLIDSDERGKISEAKPMKSLGTQRVSNLKKVIIDKQSEPPPRSSSPTRRGAVGKIGNVSDLLPIEPERQAGTSQRQKLPIGDGRVCDTLKKRLVGNIGTESESKVTLLGPRTIKLQPAPDESAGVKSLEQIKGEKAATQWKWKDKSHHELYEEMREYDQEAERPSNEAPGPSRRAPKDYYDYIHDIEDEEERKAAILAKYGVKPRPVRRSDGSSESDDDIPDHVLGSVQQSLISSQFALQSCNLPQL